MQEKELDVEATALVHETLFGDGWQNATISAAITDDDGRYIACNDAFCTLAGYSRNELVELTANLELAAGPDGGESFRRAFRGEQMFGMGDLRCKDGSAVRVNYWLVPTKVAQSDFYLVLLWMPGKGPELGPRDADTMGPAART